MSAAADSSNEWTAVVIEDDPDVRDLIQMVLTKSGFRVVVADNGSDGVEAVRQENPVLTTLDIHMPGMDGFAVARRLRQFSNTYLIMITGMVSEIDTVRGFEAGADDYLVKPFSFRELRARADSMLRRPRERHEHPIGWASSAAPAAGPEEEAVPEVAIPEVAIPEVAIPELAPHPEPTSDPSKGPEESWARAASIELMTGVPPTQRPAPGDLLQQTPPAPAVPVTTPVPVEDGLFTHGPLSARLGSDVIQLNGRRIELAQPEAALLATLMESGPRVRSKAELVLALGSDGLVVSRFVTAADKRMLDAHVESLRAKIGDTGSSPQFIETVRGVGYRMVQVS